MDDFCCKNCRFCQIEPGDEDGLCRRYPPVPIVTEESDMTVFPVVLGSWWCGEHKVLAH